ncbi:hypothetical protein V3C99_013430 [Haemonchus contortus]|uniref:SCP2 domain-containing protein n=1 Tax=Haemonchus contortus TaxID=6289 RepID=A0A7I5E6V6_HAECO|nr:Sterol-binding domain containing protein [Haemonchus contortus]CDJ91342.1 Sterol-binding domain containing protein [Haemonchus contortus]
MGVLKSDAIFEDLKEHLASNEELIKNVLSSYKINIKGDDGSVKTWIVDAKSHPPYVGHEERPFDCEVDIKEKDFMKLVAGKLRPDQAFMLGKMRLKGVVGKATRLKSLFKSSSPKAKL